MSTSPPHFAKLKPLPRVVLIHGNEELLVLEALQAVRDQARSEHPDLERLVLDQATQNVWEALPAASECDSLFSDFLLLEIHLTEAKMPESARQTLTTFLRKQPPTQCLVLRMPKLSKAQSQAKWLQELQEHGCVIAISQVSAQQFPGWLRQRLTDAGYHLDNDTHQWLSNKLHGNLLGAQQFIERLRLLYSPGTIAFAQISELSEPSQSFDVFQLMDSIERGDPEKICQIIPVLQATGVEPLHVLWAVQQSLRLLSAIRQATLSQQAKIYQQYRVWEKRKSLVQRAAQRLSQRAWHTLLNRAAQIDLICKGAKVGHSWQALLDVSLAAAGHRLF